MAGIEPATRGFGYPCSTTELHRTVKAGRRATYINTSRGSQAFGEHRMPAHRTIMPRSAKWSGEQADPLLSGPVEFSWVKLAFGQDRSGSGAGDRRQNGSSHSRHHGRCAVG